MPVQIHLLGNEEPQHRHVKNETQDHVKLRETRRFHKVQSHSDFQSLLGFTMIENSVDWKQKPRSYS